VRAAGALPALGVPPFRIWHDLFRCSFTRRSLDEGGF
jgi:hypothetical protein